MASMNPPTPPAPVLTIGIALDMAGAMQLNRIKERSGLDVGEVVATALAYYDWRLEREAEGFRVVAHKDGEDLAVAEFEGGGG